MQRGTELLDTFLFCQKAGSSHRAVLVPVARDKSVIFGETSVLVSPLSLCFPFVLSAVLTGAEISRGWGRLASWCFLQPAPCFGNCSRAAGQQPPPSEVPPAFGPSCQASAGSGRIVPSFQAKFISSESGTGCARGRLCSACPKLPFSVGCLAEFCCT